MSGSEHEIFDTQFALGQFSGNQSLLIQILEKFISQYKDVGPLLESNIQQDDKQAAKLQVHTIKGVSGNLGMKALHLASKEFENTLLLNTSAKELSEYLSVLNNTVLAAEQFCSANSDEPRASDNSKAEKTEKELLISALKHNEFISERKLQTYMDALDLPADTTDNIKKAIDDLDYSQALLLLQ